MPEILFVDTGDSGTAAAAAVLLTGYGRGRVHVSSAGEKPAAELDPVLVRVAGELDIDLADAFPKSVTSEAIQVADLIIVLGEATFSAVGVDLAERQVRHWDLPVLADRPDDAIREVLVALDRRTLLLLADLLAMPAAGAD